MLDKVNGRRGKGWLRRSRREGNGDGGEWLRRGVKFVVAGLGVLGVVVGVGSYWQREWKGENRASVVLVSEEGEVSLVSLQPGVKGVVIVKFGSEVKIELVRGYGEYRVGVVRELGEQEGLGLGLLERSLAHLMGVVVIGVVDGVGEGELETVGGLRWALLRHQRGNLQLWDRWRFWWDLGRAGKGRIDEIDLKEGEYVVGEFRAAGDAEVKLDRARFLRKTEELLADESIVEQDELSISVVNGTDEVGMAREVSERLALVGYDVVAVPSVEGRHELTRIVMDGDVEFDEEYLRPLLYLLPYRLDQANGVEERFRASLVVVLGDDYRREVRGE